MNDLIESVLTALRTAFSAVAQFIKSSFTSIQLRVASAVNVIPSAVYLYCALAIVVATVALLTLDLLPPCGYFTDPNVLFLGFVLTFGLIGLSDLVKIQFWGVMSLAVGILMWLFSAWMSTLASPGCGA